MFLRHRGSSLIAAVVADPATDERGREPQLLLIVSTTLDRRKSRRRSSHHPQEVGALKVAKSVPSRSSADQDYHCHQSRSRSAPP